MCTGRTKVSVISLDGNGFQELLRPGLQSLGMRAGRVALEAGQDCGQHSTEDHEELLIFLCGKGLLVTSEGHQLEVGQGKVAYIGPQTEHNVINNANTALVYIYCVVPAGNGSKTASAR